MKNMTKLFLFLLVFPFSVNAKTVCLSAIKDGEPNPVFVKLKVGDLGKKAIQNIIGLYDVGSQNIPVHGAAVVLTVDKVSTVKYSYTGMVHPDKTMQVIVDGADKKLAGTGTDSTVAVTFTSIPCGDIPDY